MGQGMRRGFNGHRAKGGSPLDFTWDISNGLGGRQHYQEMQETKRAGTAGLESTPDRLIYHIHHYALT